MSKQSEILLNWYDGAARELPWRVGPERSKRGERPDPYAVWLSEIMLQQTTVASVKSYFNRFMMRWPDINALADAHDDEVMAEWAGLGYYARARNLLKCAREVVELGAFPDTEEALRKLPGIGPYTAAAIAAIAFDRPAPVMDGNVERVMARLFAVTRPLPDCKPELFDHTSQLTPERRAGDYAQAVMDLGATVCTPRNPSCLVCPLQSMCKACELGIATSLPNKQPKKEKPHRFGHIYVALRRDGAWVTETRPAKGLLGGTRGFPGTDWFENEPDPKAPFEADWRQQSEEVRHVFTHFKLSLSVHIAMIEHNTPIGDYETIMPDTFKSSALPTLMKKVHSVALSGFKEMSDV